MKEFALAEPGIFIVGCIVLVMACTILLNFVMSRKNSATLPNDGRETEPKSEPIYRKVSIFAKDGKLLETTLIDKDSIACNKGHVRGTNDKGKEVIYLTTGFLVKIEEL